MLCSKASVRIAQSLLPGVQSNDIMEALKAQSLFSDSLQNSFRHQLNDYQIVTFYEGIGNVFLRLAIWRHSLKSGSMPSTVRVLTKLSFCTNQSSLCLLSNDS